MSSTSDEVGHTATPWAVTEDGFDEALLITSVARAAKVEIAAIDIGFNEPFESEQKANAAFILRAVNSHDSLVKALEEIADPENLREPKRSDHATDDAYWMVCGIWMMALKARAALSQAKGGK